MKNEIRQSYRPSSFSHEFSLGSKESSHENKSGELESTDIGSNLKKEFKSVEAPNNDGHFHFSIYKWASKGVPFFMPRRGGNSKNSLERVKFERSISSSGRIESENMADGLETTYLRDESPYPEAMKQERGPLFKTSSTDIIEEAIPSMPELKPTNNTVNIIKNLPGDTILSDRREEIKPFSLSETDFYGSTGTGIPMSKEETKKPELEPLRSLLSDTLGEKGTLYLKSGVSIKLHCL